MHRGSTKMRSFAFTQFKCFGSFFFHFYFVYVLVLVSISLASCLPSDFMLCYAMWWVNRQRRTALCLYKLIAITFHSSCHYCHHMRARCDIIIVNAEGYHVMWLGLKKNKNKMKTQQAGLLRYWHHRAFCARISHNTHTNELSKNKTYINENKQHQRHRRWTKLKESFTRCCYNMFNAFHSIDDRILMRVCCLSISPLMCV